MINHNNIRALTIGNIKYTKNLSGLGARKLQFVKSNGFFKFLGRKSVNYGLKRIRVLVPKLLESLPNDLKNKESINSFKTAIKKWSLNQVLAVFLNLCKTYLQNIEYL